jgi:DNA polymerase III alpha subunit
MIPVFKSTYSIGKSILTLDAASSIDGADSIIEICREHKIDPLVLVEDTMTGFVKAHRICKAEKIQLIFGLRISCCNAIGEEDDSEHKVIIFAKNDKGCKLLNKIYSYANISGEGKIDFKYLNSIWTPDIDLVIPFYDSFIFNNHTHLKKCVPDFSKIKPSFWVEDNNLPFDVLIREAVEEFVKRTKKNYQTTRIKTILYKNKDDIQALQTYKILCNRNFGRAASLSSPNLNHFGSDEFCLESYLENERVTA